MIKQHGTLEISRSRLMHNLGVIRGRLSPRVKCCATVKVDAYGHGVREVAGLLREAGVQWLTVYSLVEAQSLTDLRGMNLLVLAPLVVRDKQRLTREAVTGLRAAWRINITDEISAVRLSEALAAGGMDGPLNVHIQVDTGLTRSGVDAEGAQALAERVAALPGLHLEGMFAHLSHGDEPGHESVRDQVRALHRAAGPVKQRHPDLMVHIQNSGGVWNASDAGLDMVRVGIALYGLQPSTAAPIAGLLPIGRVTGPILAIHERPAGTGVGYGHTFVTQRRSRLAIVPVGYADGFPRALSNRAVAQVHGEDVPVVARVSMDQVILDVTDVGGTGVSVGDETTLISWDPAKANCADRIADLTGTIGYEIVTHFGGRLERVIVE